jgi:hypothetical protein
VAALAGCAVLPAVGPGVAVAAGTLAAASAAVGGGARPASAAIVVATLGIVGLRLLTPLFSSLLASATAGLDARLDQDAIVAASRRWRTVIASVSAGLVVSVLGAVWALLGDGPLGLALTVVAAVALALRAGSYRYLADVLPLAAGATAAFLAAGTTVAIGLPHAGDDPVGPVAVLAGTGLALAALSAVWPALPGWRWTTRPAWLVVDLLLAPLALQGLGVFDAVAQLVRHLLR